MTIEVCEGVHGDLSTWSVAVTDDEPVELREGAAMLTAQVQGGLRGAPSSANLLRWAEGARNRAKKSNGKPTEPMRKHLFAMARDLKLDRDDRLDLAEVVLGRGVGSWSELTFDEASRLIDSMAGYVLVRHLRIEGRTKPE